MEGVYGIVVSKFPFLTIVRPHELVPSSDSEPLELPSYGLRAKGWDIELNEVNKQKFMEIFLQRGSKIEESGTDAEDA